MTWMQRLFYIPLILAPTLSHAQSEQSAHEFVDHVYARYPADNTGNADLVPGKDASRIFSPSLLKLMRRDRQLAGSGYVGKLDFDPGCDCQDPDGMRVVAVNVSATVAGRAISDVHLDFGGAQKTIVHLQIIYLRQGWRIDEILAADMGSLRKLLQ